MPRSPDSVQRTFPVVCRGTAGAVGCPRQALHHEPQILHELQPEDLPGWSFRSFGELKQTPQKGGRAFFEPQEEVKHRPFWCYQVLNTYGQWLKHLRVP